jgi:Ca2+-binding EF-hand superfamily protein
MPYVEIQDYCTKLENLFNKDEIDLKKFAFKIFDVNNDGRVSENDLFELLRMCQGLKEG